jgi:hypothetical protein
VTTKDEENHRAAESSTYGLAELLQEGELLALHAAVDEATAGASREHLKETLIAHGKQTLKVHTTVGELLEGTATLGSGGGSRLRTERQKCATGRQDKRERERESTVSRKRALHT